MSRLAAGGGQSVISVLLSPAQSRLALQGDIHNPSFNLHRDQRQVEDLTPQSP